MCIPCSHEWAWLRMARLESHCQCKPGLWAFKGQPNGRLRHGSSCEDVASVLGAAERPRAKLPGGSGQALLLLYGSRQAEASRYQGPARRVSFSELLGAPNFVAQLLATHSD